VSHIPNFGHIFSSSSRCAPLKLGICDTIQFFSLENLDVMFNTGLFINDLSMHDSSRDLVLAGTQQSAELKLALDQVHEIKFEKKRKYFFFHFRKDKKVKHWKIV
jgi:hypothetical protein